MNKQQFLEQRAADWKRFEALTRTLGRRGIRRPKVDPSEFSRLLRAISYDLALLRSRDWGDTLERSVNDLIVRGHNAFYRSGTRRSGSVLHFLTAGFPALLRENSGYFWLSTALFFGPLVLAAVFVAIDPDLAQRVIPRHQLAQYEESFADGEGREQATGTNSMMAGFYVRHNVGIAFRCYATGVLFGVGSIFFLLYNGIFLGTVFGAVVAAGHSENFFAFVISHGSFELVAIAVAGAAGLVLGDSLVRPGAYSRRRALLVRGRDSIKLALGAGAMLVVAALIEGFWSPSTAPVWSKFVVGGFLWLVVILYLAFAGRVRHTPAVAPPGSMAEGPSHAPR